MGFLDGILGDVVGSALGSGNRPASNDPLSSILGGLTGGGNAGGSTLSKAALVAAVLGLIQQNGGLNGILDRFRRSGLGAHADSWVGGGPNRSVSPDQMASVLGGGSLESLAAQLGMSSGQAGSALSHLLPEIVNQMTPQGQVPDDHEDLLTKGLEMLRGAGG